MSISGDRIDVVLRVDGAEVEQLQAHPSLLDGPFTFGGATYLVMGHEVVKRDVLMAVSKVLGDDGEGFPRLGYAQGMVPTWLVILDLAPDCACIGRPCEHRPEAVA